MVLSYSATIIRTLHAMGDNMWAAVANGTIDSPICAFVPGFLFSRLSQRTTAFAGGGIPWRESWKRLALTGLGGQPGAGDFGEP